MFFGLSGSVISLFVAYTISFKILYHFLLYSFD